MTSPPFVLFRDDLAGRSILFTAPRETIIVRDGAELAAGFDRLEAARQGGLWSAGYVAYEAGYQLDPALAASTPPTTDTPLLCFGIFDAPDDETGIAAAGNPTDAAPLFSGLRPDWDFNSYATRFEKLHGHLRAGDCYQANLTFPVRGRAHADALTIFDALTERQPVRYGACVSLGEPQIVSRSPELFFKTDERGWIETHPMKGTAPRRADPAEDAREIETLRKSDKTQAENRMIVDLLRNDISRITEVGTLDVPKLFEIETYPTLHQMISVVRAKLRPNITVGEIFAALFPCGSVTGAPKIRAMQILAALETAPREAYCGAIGFIAPNGMMRFNVAIRTISLFADGRAVFNVGGGIIFDSEAHAEYEEALLKARFAGDLLSA